MNTFPHEQRAGRQWNHMKRILGIPAIQFVNVPGIPRKAAGKGEAVNIAEPRLTGIKVTEDEIIVSLVDGRVVSVPLAWSWRLSDATPEQRQRFEIIGDGIGIHWPEVDEDISVEGMLFGLPARRPAMRAVSIP